jgi:hypothetical protein
MQVPDHSGLDTFAETFGDALHEHEIETVKVGYGYPGVADRWDLHAKHPWMDVCWLQTTGAAPPPPPSPSTHPPFPTPTPPPRLPFCAHV